MNKEEFVETVTKRLGGPMNDKRDAALEARMLGKFFTRGFSIGDAVRYCQCTEERNPSLEESIALARMAEIQKKYPPIDYSV